MDAKRCSKCRQVRDVAEFAAHKHTRDGLQSWCRRCKATQMRIRRAEQKAAAAS